MLLVVMGLLAHMVKSLCRDFFAGTMDFVGWRESRLGDTCVTRESCSRKREQRAIGSTDNLLVSV